MTLISSSQAGWKENLATFMNELKNIKANGLSTLGPAIKNVYDVLNINRMQSGKFFQCFDSISNDEYFICNLIKLSQVLEIV